MNKIYETVTVTREITGPIKDLVLFAKYLCKQGVHMVVPDDETLVKFANEFWDNQHGED